MVNMLLQDERVDPSDANNAAFRTASYNGALEVVKRLLQDDRVDPSSKDNYALRRACVHGYTDVADLILQDSRLAKTVMPCEFQPIPDLGVDLTIYLLEIMDNYCKLHVRQVCKSWKNQVSRNSVWSPMLSPEFRSFAEQYPVFAPNNYDATMQLYFVGLRYNKDHNVAVLPSFAWMLKLIQYIRSEESGSDANDSDSSVDQPFLIDPLRRMHRRIARLNADVMGEGLSTDSESTNGEDILADNLLSGPEDYLEEEDDDEDDDDSSSANELSAEEAPDDDAQDSTGVEIFDPLDILEDAQDPIGLGIIDPLDILEVPQPPEEVRSQRRRNKRIVMYPAWKVIPFL